MPIVAILQAMSPFVGTSIVHGTKRSKKRELPVESLNLRSGGTMRTLEDNRWAARLLAICILFCGATAGLAQVDTGTILGTVKDPTGAVLPDAKVSITNQGTAEQVTTTTREDGTYIVTPLKIGTYRIRVEHAGFKTDENASFDLNIQQHAVVDFQL